MMEQKLQEEEEEVVVEALHGEFLFFNFFLRETFGLVVLKIGFCCNICLSIHSLTIRLPCSTICETISSRERSILFLEDFSCWLDFHVFIDGRLS